ncbi:MAG: hypothetical protein KUG64_10950 [Cycloclasticus sp.]|nr:hypothetical protein [Cycloclasticus sp.]
MNNPNNPNNPKTPTELDFEKDRVEQLQLLLEVIKTDIRELYAMRGEDELTAKYCNAILALKA